MNNEDKKLSILGQIFGSSKKEGREHIYMCPRCKYYKPKLSINLSKNKYKCWICSKDGKQKGSSIFKLILKYGTHEHIEQWRELEDGIDLQLFEHLFQAQEEQEEKYIDFPDDFKFIFDPKNKKNSLKAIHYLLEERKLDKSDIFLWRFGLSQQEKFRERVIIPSFDEKGNINYYVARSYTNHPIRYINPEIKKTSIIFNELLLDFEKDLIITEGAFDAIKAENCVPILGNEIFGNERETILFSKIIKNDTPIFMALDSDAWAFETKIIDYFLLYEIEIHKINLGKYKDLGEMSREEIKQAKEEAQIITQDNMFHYKMLEGLKKI